MTQGHEIRAQREPAQLTQALRNAQLAVSGLASAGADDDADRG